MVAEANQTKFGALAQIVARNLDEIEDLPEYKTPPPGVYSFLIESCKQKNIGGKTAIVTTYVIVDTIELNNPEEYEEKERVNAGDKFSEAFWFNDPETLEQTLSVLKAKYGGLGESLGTVNLLEIMEKMEGMTVKGVIKNRVDSKDSTKVYPSTRDIVPAV